MSSKILLRLLCLTLCLAVLLPCVTAAGETTKVAAYLLRLREKPSLDAKVLDAYKRGTRVTILKKGTEWTKVQVGSKVGYMQSNRLAYARYKTAAEKETAVNTKSTEKTTSAGSVAYVMKGVRLNLREAADSGSEIIASFRGGKKVTVLKRGKYWYYVEVDGLRGYMGADYLTDEKE